MAKEKNFENKIKEEKTGGKEKYVFISKRKAWRDHGVQHR